MPRERPATKRQLREDVKWINDRMQTQGFRAYLRDMLPTKRASVEAERMLDSVIALAVRVGR